MRDDITQVVADKTLQVDDYSKSYLQCPRPQLEELRPFYSASCWYETSVAGQICRLLTTKSVRPHWTAWMWCWSTKGDVHFQAPPFCVNEYHSSKLEHYQAQVKICLRPRSMTLS